MGCVMLSLLKTFLPLPLLLAFVTSAAAQPVREHDVGARALAFHGQVNLKAPTYEASAEARKVVQRIMGAIGLAANFDIRAAPGVDYAQAVVDNGGRTRLILYNPTWMDGLSATLGDTWPKVSVLAHEIGHHLQFHMHADFANHEAELQADKFSGHILRKLGASLEQALLPMAYIGEVLETDTHPRRSLRIAAITQGWKEADAGDGANVIKAVKPAPAVAAGQRVALLIGNTNYKLEAPLKNPKNDVIAIQRELRKLGFSTTTLYDGTSEQIADYVRLFQAEANGADWALFYFAGRGIEVDGINYMVPIDANGDLPTFTRDHPNMRLETAFESVRGAKLVRLVVADSCRVDPANPPDAFNRVEPSRVFKVIEPPRGIVVAYSTRAGLYASDGIDEDLSPYAQALIKVLREPGIELDRVFRRVNAEVFQATKGIQEPSVLGTWPAEDLHLAAK